jgi:hypothetical protein
MSLRKEVFVREKEYFYQRVVNLLLGAIGLKI